MHVAADSSRLDAWLVERDLPPDLGTTLREQGYSAPEALYTTDGSSALSEKQLKDWRVLPWHRRKFLAAIAAQAEEQLVADASPAPIGHGDVGSNLLANQEHVRRSHEEPEEKSPQAPTASSVIETQGQHSLERGAMYSTKLVPQFKKSGHSLVSLADAEAALGLMLDVRQHASLPPVVSGVVVSGPAHEAGVLLGSLLLTVNGRATVAPHANAGHPPTTDATLIGMVQDAVSHSAASEGSQIELSFQSPGPLSAASHEAATDVVASAPTRPNDKRSGRRGKRAAVAAKKKKKRRGEREDTTERFHAALQGLRDIPLAEAMVEASIEAAAAAIVAKGKKGRPGEQDDVTTTKDIIDFGRPMELHMTQAPRPESAINRQEDSVRPFKTSSFHFQAVFFVRDALG